MFDDTLGELVTREALAPWIPYDEAEAAAAGWDGDRARVYDDGKGGLVLVWRSLWDGADDARAFADAENRALGKRRALAGALPGGVFLRGDEVVVVLGRLPVPAVNVAEALWTAPASAPSPASAPASAPTPAPAAATP
jgi:hypothetical protein